MNKDETREFVHHVLREDLDIEAKWKKIASSELDVEIARAWMGESLWDLSDVGGWREERVLRVVGALRQGKAPGPVESSGAWEAKYEATAKIENIEADTQLPAQARAYITFAAAVACLSVTPKSVTLCLHCIAKAMRVLTDSESVRAEEIRRQLNHLIVILAWAHLQQQWQPHWDAVRAPEVALDDDDASADEVAPAPAPSVAAIEPGAQPAEPIAVDPSAQPAPTRLPVEHGGWTLEHEGAQVWVLSKGGTSFRVIAEDAAEASQLLARDRVRHFRELMNQINPMMEREADGARFMRPLVSNFERSEWLFDEWNAAEIAFLNCRPWDQINRGDEP